MLRVGADPLPRPSQSAMPPSHLCPLLDPAAYEMGGSDGATSKSPKARSRAPSKFSRLRKRSSASITGSALNMFCTKDKHGRVRVRATRTGAGRSLSGEDPWWRPEDACVRACWRSHLEVVTGHLKKVGRGGRGGKRGSASRDAQDLSLRAKPPTSL